MISYLNHIREENKDKGMINIILDNAGYNRSYEVKEAASKLKIKLIYLPPYCPNLNLIERLWKYFKKKVTKNRYYPTFEEFYCSVTLFFKDLENRMDDLRQLLTLNFGIIKAS